jgi:hypothetical protein
MNKAKTVILYTLAIAYVLFTELFKAVVENKEEIQLHLELFFEAVVKGTQTAVNYTYTLGADVRLWWEVDGKDQATLFYTNLRQGAVVYGLLIPA